MDSGENSLKACHHWRVPVAAAIAIGALWIAGCLTDGDRPKRSFLALLGSTPKASPDYRATFGKPIAVDTANSDDRQNSERDVPIQPVLQEEITSPQTQAIEFCFSNEAIIDLDGAFRLANVANPRIGLAEELVQAQLAEQMLARSLLFPNINVGATLSIHRGHLLAASGTLRDVDRESLYLGAGANVRGAGTVAVPGVHVVSHLGDAVFAPRVAQQRVQRSRFDSAATQNEVLLNVARAYLGLAGAEARLLALRQSEKELSDLAKLTADFAAKGAGREADALRAAGELALLRTAILRVEEETIARAAELARLLSADATIRLRPEIGVPPLIQLFDNQADLDSLLDSALANRPDIAARSADVAIGQTRLRQERIRPFLPAVSVGFSAGDFGGGSNLVGYRMGSFGSRTDLGVVAVWTLQNAGMGNRAVQNTVQAQVEIAEAMRMQVVDRARRDVMEAHSQMRTSRHQMEIAKRRVQTAQQAFQQDFLRTKDQLGKLIETLSSFNLLVAARQDLVQAIVGYSQAQFELLVATGGTPSTSRTIEAHKE